MAPGTDYDPVTIQCTSGYAFASKPCQSPTRGQTRYSDRVPLPEKALISRIREKTRPGRSLVTGIGDDCAIQRVGRGFDLLVTTDFCIEGVHFRREWHPSEVVGRRCLTRGLSDIAAMGGEPTTAFLSLALPRKLPQRWVDQFFKGLLATAAEFKTTLAGGDIAESPGGICADIAVTGYVPRGQAVLRSGAWPGDEIYVTGVLGGSAAALGELSAGRKVRPQDFPRHFAPGARVEIGRVLRRKRLASSMIDLSDGLSTDLGHICEESEVGAEISAAAIPRALVGRTRSAVTLEQALHGGEDYELLFTSRSGKHIPTKIAGVPITRIGRITRQRKIVLMGENRRRTRFRAQGWEHFAI
jgi:thiamine-monophosphate kinase